MLFGNLFNGQCTYSASRQDAPPSSMKCGVSSAPKRLHGGGGIRLIITPGELAYVVGTRRDAAFLKLQAPLAPFGDKASVYQRHLPAEQHTVGKLTMQKIERKPLTLRSRLQRFARKALCFSRSRVMPDLTYWALHEPG